MYSDHKTAGKAGRSSFAQNQPIPPTRENIRTALSYLSPDLPHDDWWRIGAAIYDGLNGDGFDLFDEWSKEGQSYSAASARDTWKAIKPGGGITIATLWRLALNAGWKPDSEGWQETEAERTDRERKRQAWETKCKADEAKVLANHEKKAAEAVKLLDAATGDPASHPYAVKKRVSLGPLVRRGDWPQRKWKNALLIPLQDAGGKVWSLEAISFDGNKAFLKDGRVAGCFHPLGEVRGATRGYIGEGLATVAAVHAVTGSPCVAAMSAGNLHAVALAVRELAPDAEIIFLADDDPKPNGRNPGLEAATKAALAVGGIVAVPGMGRKADFWDLWHEQGLDAVRDALTNAKAPEAMGGNGDTTQRNEAQADEITDYPQPPDDWAGYGPDLHDGYGETSKDLPPFRAKRPIIKVIGGTLPEQVEKAEAALIWAGVEIYQRQGDLVRPYHLSHAIDEKGVSIPAGSMVLGSVDKNWIAKEMTRAAEFSKYDIRSREYRSVDCPPRVAETYLSSVGEWKVLPIIGISECPTMRRDGSIILKSGYDRLSGIFVDYHGPQIQVFDNPTRQDAIDALVTLKKPLAEFPFVEPMDEAVVLSAILTAVVRRSLPTAPLHAFDAPKAGSGKGLLADTVAMISTGRTAVMASQGADEAEDEKRLSSLLMRSSPVICIDNIERPIRGDFLCSMLTQTIITARVLGFSKMVDLPTNSTILATGNNLAFLGDMTRRGLVCRIDPQCERPDSLSFAVNLHEWVPANRHKLISAALTILRAYHVAGRPDQGIKPYGSFEGWSGLVRSALVWLGEADPCDTRRRIEEADPVSTELSAVLALWHQTFGASGKTTAEVVEACALAVHADLKHALLEVAMSSRNAEAIDSKRLGKWLKKFERRIEGGLRIEKAGEDTHSKVTFWRVATVGKFAGSAGFAGNTFNPDAKNCQTADSDIFSYRAGNDTRKTPHYPQSPHDDTEIF